MLGRMRIKRFVHFEKVVVRVDLMVAALLSFFLSFFLSRRSSIRYQYTKRFLDVFDNSIFLMSRTWKK